MDEVHGGSSQVSHMSWPHLIRRHKSDVKFVFNNNLEIEFNTKESQRKESCNV